MSLNITDVPSPPPPSTTMAPVQHHKAMEDICITLAVFSLIIINISLFLFWRYKALGKSPLPFRRYSTESEGYATLHQPVMTKDNIHSAKPQRRVQEVLKQYASTVVRAGQNHIARKSSGSFYASFSGESSPDASPVHASISSDTKKKATTLPSRKSEEQCSILAYEQSPARLVESGVYDDNSIKFKLGHPEDDSTTTGGDSDSQVYCEVVDFAGKRHGRHIRPISFDFCKDQDDSRSLASRNNNDASLSVESRATDDSGGIENVYENFRKKKPTSNFASMTNSKASPSRESIAAMYSTCRTVSGDYATCDASGSWRPTSFAFCRDAPPSVTDTTLSRTSMVSEQYPQDENSTYEQFVEPDDPIYAQTVIRRSKRSVKQYPSSLPRDDILSSQPLYEQPLFEQPLYENLEKSEQEEGGETDHRYSSLHLAAPMNNHLTASDSKINVNSDSRRSRRGHAGGGAENRRINARDSTKPVMDNCGDVSPHATSPGVNVPDTNMTSNQSSFHTIARELAGLHEDSIEEYDPEETFPVMQMLSDRYSTGNFLNKFY
nr:uncharacterized protein LOC129279964 [Lytechinus pictus]